ncbi:MAG TPA: adenylate cyclase regulatory domain-containing protein [Solirubrobacteraceae bacterium]|nr:adenylate cyclase regulatory domain-containing protein [Solirubrobacteraceae bacterium]
MAEETLTGDDETTFEAAGLLEGLGPAARAERVDLLRYLMGLGFPLDQLRHHTALGTLTLLPANRVLGGDLLYTHDEVVERSGVDGAMLDQLRQAMGFPRAEPEELAFSDADIESARLAMQAYSLGVSEEDLIDVTRVLSRGLAQSADLMREVALRRVLEPGLSERELAERLSLSADMLLPIIRPLVGHLLMLHMRGITQDEMIGAAERAGGVLPGVRDVSVAFADLVGFTRVGEEVLPAELGRVAARLETMALSLALPPVSLVKSIGDAVLLVSPDPEPLLHCSLSLIDAADAEGEAYPQLRVGVARGPAQRHAGDWYGRPVNLASRVTGVARPGSVLATSEVHDSARDAFRWSFAGERRIRGVRGPVAVFRARELGAGG